MVWSAIQDFVKESEVRIVNDNLHVRMLPDVAKNYDLGLYTKAVDMWSDLVREISQIKIDYPDNKKSVFYIYFVPDDFYRGTEYEGASGRPEFCLDEDGFPKAVCQLQQTLHVKVSNLFGRVSKLHELAHCIHSKFGLQARLFGEGFAEIIPWYVLGYERRLPSHLEWMCALPRIYTIQDYYDDKVPHTEKNREKIASFRSGYVSAYLLVRSIVSSIEERFKISPCSAVQKFLELWGDLGYVDAKEFASWCANFAGMDPEKLIYTCEYQNKVLDDIQKGITKQIQWERNI